MEPPLGDLPVGESMYLCLCVYVRVSVCMYVSVMRCRIGMDACVHVCTYILGVSASDDMFGEKCVHVSECYVHACLEIESIIHVDRNYCT